MIAGLKCWRLTGDHKHLTSQNIRGEHHSFVKSDLGSVGTKQPRETTSIPGATTMLSSFSHSTKRNRIYHEFELMPRKLSSYAACLIALFLLVGCQTSSRPEMTVADFHKLLAEPKVTEGFDFLATERYSHTLNDAPSRVALRELFVSRGIFRKSDEGLLEVTPELALEVHYPKRGQAQVNVSYPEASEAVLTYLLVLDGGLWRITFIAEPIAIIPNREILVPQDTLWDR